MADLESVSIGVGWISMGASLRQNASLSIRDYPVLDENLLFLQTAHPSVCAPRDGGSLFARGLWKMSSLWVGGLEVGAHLPSSPVQTSSFHHASHRVNNQEIVYNDTLTTQLRLGWQGEMSVLLGHRWGGRLITYIKLGGRLSTARFQTSVATDLSLSTQLGTVSRWWVSPYGALGMGWALSPQWEVGLEAFTTCARTLSFSLTEGDVTTAPHLRVRQTGLRFQLVYHLYGGKS